MMTGSAKDDDDLLDAFTGMADSLADDFTVDGAARRLTSSCLRSLPVAAAGVLLADRQGELQVTASSNLAVQQLNLHESQCGDGPSVVAYRQGVPVHIENIGTAISQWPDYARHAVKAGCRATHALPLRLREQCIGSVNLLCGAAQSLSGSDLRVGQTLADIATISILQHRALFESRRVAAELQSALRSRILIEQAKGRLVERGNLASADQAFALLRSYARRTNQRVAELAHAIMDNSLDTSPILASDRPMPGP